LGVSVLRPSRQAAPYPAFLIEIRRAVKKRHLALQSRGGPPAPTRSQIISSSIAAGSREAHRSQQDPDDADSRVPTLALAMMTMARGRGLGARREILVRWGSEHGIFAGCD
jgi:hypothetical protein